METAIHRRVQRLRAGEDAGLIARMPSGWAVLGEQQFLRGYALLLPDPVVDTFNDLAPALRAQVMHDAGALGDALLAVTGALRINYAIFGNLEPALHIHVVPRFADESATLRTAHPWVYDWNAAPRLDPARDGSLIAQLRSALQRLDQIRQV
ncbi:MAG: HIT domain-containing protein [Steroidobacteraceae bacterium]